MNYVMQNGVNRRRLMLVLRILLTIALLALLGCGSSAPVVDTPPQVDSKRPQTLAELRAAGRKKLAERRLAMRPTREQLWERRRAFNRVLAPEARLAFERAGLPVVQPVKNPAGKAASNTLPMFVEAQKQYTGPGDYGFIANSPDVTYTELPDDPGAHLSPAGTTFPGDFSYIIYRVDDITQIPTALSVTLLGGPFPPGLECGIAAYNWAAGSTGRWEPLFYGDASAGWISAQLDLTPGAAWTNANNNMAFALFALAPHVIDVQGIDISEKPSNMPPNAWLEVSPSSGPAPLATTLDASLSQDDDGTIENYSFDPGDGTGFVDNGADPTFDHTYVNPGPFSALVQVTDDGGLTSEWQTTVIVSPATYDEIEDNDDAANAQMLPTLPFENFSGGVGLGGNNDGDEHDYFQFQTDPIPGDKIEVNTMYASDGGNTVIWTVLEDAFGEITSTNDPFFPLQWEFQGWETAPFRIHIYTESGASDYFLSIDDDYFVPVVYDEDEFFGNDEALTANYLWPLDGGYMSTWKGSLGSGPDYEGFDGDSDDWYFMRDPNYSFGATYIPEDATLTLDLTYDIANSTAMSITLYDANANELGSNGNGDGTETITHTVLADDAQPFYVKIHLGGGYGDYNLAGSVEVVNPGVDEDEHNDNMAIANDLGAFPFADDSFTGNVGYGGNYDGDYEDFFTFQANSGEILEITVTPVTNTGGFQSYLMDATGNIFGGSDVDPGTGEVSIQAMITPSIPTPYYLLINDYSGLDTDYTITSQLGSFTEVEDNDDTTTANQLPDTYVPFFAGSLGDGGSNYDGDAVDMMWFNSQQGFPIEFWINYDQTKAMAFFATIRDANGDVMAVGDNNGSGQIHLSCTVEVGDSSPYYITLDCPPLPGNFTDYWFYGTPGP